jgi:uncharacterized protein (DUF2237 family)
MDALNVLGGPLEACSFDPLTGFFAPVAALPTRRTTARTWRAPSAGATYVAGKAPPVHLQATHSRALDIVTLAQLQEHALQLLNS